jgi:hypothetical protein
VPSVPQFPVSSRGPLGLLLDYPSVPGRDASAIEDKIREFADVLEFALGDLVSFSEARELLTTIAATGTTARGLARLLIAIEKGDLR